MTNTEGDWLIAAHISQLLELLEAHPEFSEPFIDGDASVLVTRTGFTFNEFQPKPLMFYAAPMTEEAEAVVLVSSAREACRLFFDGLDRTPEAMAEWVDGKHELVVRDNVARVRRRQ